jgi:hypothetical protein
MAGMDSEQTRGSCNAAVTHFLQVREEYSGGDERKLGGDRYLDDVRGPTARRGWTVNRYQVRARRRGCTFSKFRQNTVAGFNGNLAMFDTFTIFEAHRHGGDGQ